MTKGSNLIDFLIEDRLPGVDRKDLEARLKLLRAAGLYPRSRRVGDKETEAVNEEHCANVILALLCADPATDTVPAVERFSQMRLVSGAVSDSAGMNVFDEPIEDAGTLRDELAKMIWHWRRGVRPWADDLELIGLLAKIEGTAGVLLEFERTERAADGSKVSDWLCFGDDEARSYLGREKMISMYGHIIGWMAQFLGPSEETAAA